MHASVNMLLKRKGCLLIFFKKGEMGSKVLRDWQPTSRTWKPRCDSSQQPPSCKQIPNSTISSKWQQTLQNGWDRRQRARHTWSAAWETDWITWIRDKISWRMPSDIWATVSWPSSSNSSAICTRITSTISNRATGRPTMKPRSETSSTRPCLESCNSWVRSTLSWKAGETSSSSKVEVRAKVHKNYDKSVLRQWTASRKELVVSRLSRIARSLRSGQSWVAF